jgi:hypothetical protein
MKQSQRTKNRIKEHAGHGWKEIDKSPHFNFNGRFVNEAILFECPCGWIGWLPSEELR